MTNSGRALIRRALACGLWWGGLGGAWAASAADEIKEIRVNVDGDTDLPRVLELLSLREGDKYTDSGAERGLIRLADTGKFLGVQSQFDAPSGVLNVNLSLVPRIGDVETAITPAPGDVVPDEFEAEVEEVAGLNPGDAIFPDALPSIRERVLNRTRDRGYRSARAIVTLEQRENGAPLKAVVAVDMGRRSHVSKVTLKGFSRADVTTLFKSLGVSVKTPVTAEAGNLTANVDFPYDSIRLDEAVSAWNLQAREEGYYDFHLVISEQVLEDGNFELIWDLKRGLRYNLQIKGNVAFWERDLRAKVTDRAVRLGVPLSIQEGETLLKAEYEKAGFGDVTVQSQVRDDEGRRRVEFEIVEGPRYMLGNLRVTGAPPNEDALIQSKVVEWRKPYLSPFQKPIFDEKTLKSELPSLLGLVRSLGYLDVRPLEIRPIHREDSRFVDVEIPLQFGEKYLIRNVTLNGNLTLSEDELEQIIDIAPGDPVDPVKVALVREKLIKRYRELGFLDVKIGDDEAKILRKSRETFQVDIEFDVDQGPLIIVGTAVLDGLRRTKENVILRELNRDTLTLGSIWTPGGQERLEQKLLNLSIFGSVTFEPVGGEILERAAADGTSIEIQRKDLKIAVTERPAGAFEFGPGFRTDKGLIGFAEVSYRNLGGQNRSAQLRAQVSKKIRNPLLIEQNYSFTYLEPYILQLPLRLRFNTQVDIADKHVRKKGVLTGYNRDLKSFSFETETEIARNLRWIQKLYTLAFTRYFDVNYDPTTTSDVQSDAKYRTATVGTTLTYDKRDDVFNPSKGWLLNSSIEYSSPKIGSKDLVTSSKAVGFSRFKQEATMYFPLPGQAVVALSASYTQLWALGRVPPDNRPTLGGMASIRALPENALRFAGDDVGDQQAIEAHLEYRHPIFYDLGVAYFVDAGEIDALQKATDGTQTRLSTGMRTGIGVGLRYKTVVGPIALDVAFNTNPLMKDGKAQEDVTRIVFRIGAF